MYNIKNIASQKWLCFLI